MSTRTATASGWERDFTYEWSKRVTTSDLPDEGGKEGIYRYIYRKRRICWHQTMIECRIVSWYQHTKRHLKSHIVTFGSGSALSGEQTRVPLWIVYKDYHRLSWEYHSPPKSGSSLSLSPRPGEGSAGLERRERSAPTVARCSLPRCPGSCRQKNAGERRMGLVESFLTV